MAALRLAAMFGSRDLVGIDMVRPMRNTVSGPGVYTGSFGIGLPMTRMANVLLSVHAVTDAETPDRRSGPGLEPVPGTLDGSHPGSANCTVWFS